MGNRYALGNLKEEWAVLKIDKTTRFLVLGQPERTCTLARAGGRKVVIHKSFADLALPFSPSLAIP